MKIRNLQIKFFPETMNEMIKFFKNTRPGCSYNLIESQQLNFDELYSIQEFNEE